MRTRTTATFGALARTTDVPSGIWGIMAALLVAATMLLMSNPAHAYGDAGACKDVAPGCDALCAAATAKGNKAQAEFSVSMAKATNARCAGLVGAYLRTVREGGSASTARRDPDPAPRRDPAPKTDPTPAPPAGNLPSLKDCPDGTRVQENEDCPEPRFGCNPPEMPLRDQKGQIVWREKDKAAECVCEDGFEEVGDACLRECDEGEERMSNRICAPLFLARSEACALEGKGSAYRVLTKPAVTDNPATTVNEAQAATYEWRCAAVGSTIPAWVWWVLGLVGLALLVLNSVGLIKAMGAAARWHAADEAQYAGLRAAFRGALKAITDMVARLERLRRRFDGAVDDGENEKAFRFGTEMEGLRHEANRLHAAALEARRALEPVADSLGREEPAPVPDLLELPDLSGLQAPAAAPATMAPVVTAPAPTPAPAAAAPAPPTLAVVPPLPEAAPPAGLPTRRRPSA